MTGAALLVKLFVDGVSFCLKNKGLPINETGDSRSVRVLHQDKEKDSFYQDRLWLLTTYWTFGG